MVKNITLSVEEVLIVKARQKAHKQNKTLNQIFREWMERFVGDSANTDYKTLLAQMSHVKAGKKFSRDEMNER